jgi:hypothetical protein
MEGVFLINRRILTLKFLKSHPKKSNYEKLNLRRVESGRAWIDITNKQVEAIATHGGKRLEAYIDLAAIPKSCTYSRKFKYPPLSIHPKKIRKNHISGGANRNLRLCE